MSKNRFRAKDRGAPKSTGPVVIATFVTTVDPALILVFAYGRYCWV